MAYDGQEEQGRASLENMPAEAGILGAILFEASALNHVFPWLKPEHFASEVNAELYEEACKRWQEGKSANPEIMFDVFSRRKGNPPWLKEYLNDLTSNAAFGPEVRDYGEIIKDLAERRELRDILAAGISSVYEEAASFDAVSGVLNAINGLSDKGPEAASWLMADAHGDEIFEPLPAERLLCTPWVDLNEKLRFKRGEMHLIAARPSMGKSAFGVDLAFGLGRAGHGVGVFSLEMDSGDMMRRAACDAVYERGMMGQAHKHAPFYESLMSGACTREQVEWARRGLDAIKRLPVGIDDRAGLTVPQIKFAARRLRDRMEKKGVELRALLIDHVGKIRPHIDRKGSRYAETCDISEALHSMAKELDVALIGLSQLNRAVEGRGVQRPQLSDLRDSGKWEEDAYSVSFLYRPEYYLQRKKREDGSLTTEDCDKLEKCQNRIEVIIEKHRNGPIGTVPLFCDVRANAIRDLTFREERRAA